MARSQLLLNRYRIISQAGAGGYGTVQHAYDTHLKRDVAIKCIELSEDEVARARLVALEARMAAALEDDDTFVNATVVGEATAGASSSFPSDPDFLRARDERRAGRSGGARTSAGVAAGGSGEVPPWDDDSLVPWGAGTADFGGAASGGAAGRAQSSLRGGRRRRAAGGQAPYEASAVVEDFADDYTDSGSVRVDHLQGIRATHTASVPIRPEDLDPDDLFEHIPGLQEARSVAHLNDANIVTVYDFAMEGSTAYVIMEYIEGKTLAEVIDELDDNITLDMVAAVFASVSHALEAAHGESMLHLDIKPENVIINSKGVVKVTDFGLAALMDGTGTGTTGGGTIGYMPLEQMRREPLDVRSDEWALASLTYEMLTGTNPFFAPTLHAAEEAIEDAELVLPSLCWDELDAEADDIMFTALDPDMDERYDTVAEFADELLPYLGSTRKGKQVLADIVNGNVEEEDEPEEYEPREPGPPLVDRLGLRGGFVVARVAAALGVGLLAATGLANIHGFGTSPVGLIGDVALLAWVLIALAAGIAALKPTVGLLVGYGMFVIGLCAAQGWLLALVMVVLCVGWWYLMRHRGMVPPAVALCQPLFGSVGFAAIAPVAAGALLPVMQSMVCAAFAFASAVVMASCGSLNVMNWDVLAHLSATANPQAAAGALLSQMGTWAIGLSWVVAAGAYSLCCARGTKNFDIAGGVIAAVVLLAGVCAAAHWTNFGGSWLPDPAALLGALVPGVAGIVAAAMNIPDRARWAEEEWDFVGEEEYEEG